MCATGYATLGTSCVECIDAGLNVLVLIVLIGLAALLCYMLIKSAKVSDEQAQLTAAESSKQEKKGSLGVIFKVTMNYLQMLYYLGRLAANWSDIVERLFAAVGIVGAFSANNFSVRCAANWRFYDILMMMYISPIVIVAVLAGIYLCIHIIHSKDLRHTKMDFQHAAMLLLYQVHPTIMLEVIGSFPCTDVPGTGTSFLKEDMNVDCKSAEYKSFAAISSLYLFFYLFGMLVVVVWRLRIHHKSGDLDIPSSSSFQKYAFFFVGYRGKTYFWEAVVMMRKLGIVAFSVMSSPALQLVFGIVIVTIAWVLNAQWSPYSSNLVNRMDSIALIALYVTIILGFLFLNTDNSNSTWITVLLVLVNTATIVFLLSLCAQRIREYASKWFAALDVDMSKWRRTTTGLSRGDKDSSTHGIVLQDRKTAKVSRLSTAPQQQEMSLDSW